MDRERFTNYLHLRLTASERQALQAAAERDGRRVSDVARDALRAILAGGQTPGGPEGGLRPAGNSLLTNDTTCNMI